MRGWLGDLPMHGSRTPLPAAKAAGSAFCAVPVSWFRPRHGRRAAAARWQPCLSCRPLYKPSRPGTARVWSHCWLLSVQSALLHLSGSCTDWCLGLAWKLGSLPLPVAGKDKSAATHAAMDASSCLCFAHFRR